MSANSRRTPPSHPPIDRNFTPDSSFLRMGAALVLGLLLALGGGLLHRLPLTEPAIAQFIQPEQFAPSLYQRLPELPRENQYISRETGEIDPNNSLATRLIRYHLYIKTRSPQYRFDWKITLADYLGINDPMRADLYPGSTTLQQNPMDKDIAVVRSFNRKQREQLIDALVAIFKPTPQPNSTPQPAATPSAPIQPNPSNYKPPTLPQPGAADLLKP
ncbi:hypothetical protein [Oscillatoria sp. FACHB-1406]|uniref:hypothetical protein n=1 Tax=Oscillatoria sp. FACHB-1406 TaxID=2692846 RepID=UPI001684B3DC|nr:hypothetical protein [Oscillatoria sp. FACHB-1406]MBD2579560.1 hypothetical protein [Oscillatoria sp. FACHB-1406]